jgi:flagellar L-ring protein precursor FlgH
MWASGQSLPPNKSLEEYIRQAKANSPQLVTPEGSLYNTGAVNASLFTDFKARRANDIITIRVIESTVAESSADAQTNRSSSVDLGVPKFFGANTSPSSNLTLEQLIAANSDMQFQGDGSTNRSGSVSAFLSGRVADVLPNGDLVIEAVKEVKVNNERQVIRLLGVVRAVDIGPNNVVLSGAISNLQLQIDGKGVLSDTIQPGFFFRILTKFWPF